MDCQISNLLLVPQDDLIQMQRHTELLSRAAVRLSLLLQLIIPVFESAYLSSLLTDTFVVVFGHILISNLNVSQYLLILLLDLVENIHIVLVLLQTRPLRFGDVALQIDILLHVFHVAELEQVALTLLQVHLADPRTLQWHFAHIARHKFIIRHGSNVGQLLQIVVRVFVDFGLEDNILG